MFSEKYTDLKRIRASYPEDLRKLEYEAIQVRRAEVNAAKGVPDAHGKFNESNSEYSKCDGAPDHWWLNDGIGLAISGGGLRSAIHALGLLQAMARVQFLRRVDFLSTVSGGGYIGSFWGRHYLREAEWKEHENKLEEKRKQLEEEGKENDCTTFRNIVDSTEESIANSWSPPVYWLRENGRYLSPRGGGDLWSVAAQVLRSTLSVHALLVITILIAAFATIAAKGVFWQWESGAINPCETAEIEVLFTNTPAAATGSLDLSMDLKGERLDFHGVVHAQPSVVAPLPAAAGQPTMEPERPMLENVLVSLGKVFDRATITKYTGMPLLLAAVFFLVMCAVYWFNIFRLYLYFYFRHDDLAEMKKSKRRRLDTELLAAVLGAMAIIAVIRAVDLAGLQLYHSQGAALEAAAAGIIAAIGFAAHLWGGSLLSGGESKWGSVIMRFLQPILLLVGSVLFFVYGAVIFALAYAIILTPIGGQPDAYQFPLWTPIVGTAVMLLIGYQLGWLKGFLNHTSYNALYSARLARTFLGATNPDRWEATGKSVMMPDEQDDVLLKHYRPHERGGPLHIINTTLNETVSGHSQIQSRDRKGLPFAVSSLAVSLGVSHHARWKSPAEDRASQGTATTTAIASPQPKKYTPSELEPIENKGQQDGYRVFSSKITPEELGISRWIGISGAAVSTGMGSYTGMGLSMLLGFFNVRTGYWWDTNVKPSQRTEAQTTVSRVAQLERFWGDLLRSVFTIQSYLVDEMLGHFRGPALRLWNLSDGGHFENSGAYELVRRQLPLIIVLDNGADPGYCFDGLAEFIRRIKVDFAADITFLELDTESGGINDEARIFEDWLRGEKTFGGGNDAASEFKIAVSKLLRDGAQQELLGPVRTICGGRDGGGSHAAVGLLRYAHTDRVGVLIWVKLSMSGDEDPDLMAYAMKDSSFPNQTTADQFFDEAQWESYRKLGRHVGKRLMETLQPDLIEALMKR